MSTSIEIANGAPVLEEAEPGFAAYLRDRTKAIHREAERSGFIADLIRGRAERSGYALFLRNFVPAYEAMERALAAAPDGALLSPFADPRLRRLDALARDLEALAGTGWRARLAILPEAEDYAAAIAAAGHGPLLAAHAYARYLGDLSGGQILKPLLGRTLGLGPDALGFYDFPDVADLAAPKAAMRRALDTVDRHGVDAEPIVDEAIAAFRHNIAVSQAVQAALA